MKKNFYLFFLFLPLLSLKSEENLTSLSLQAEALWNVRDYAAASKLYEELLSHSLPHWQQARIRYNLGTIYLAQHQVIDALNLFQQIDPVNLSLPRFGRDLFLNEGIAYLEYAQTNALASFLNLQAIFIQQSLKAFDQAQILDCQVQKEESSPSCQHSFLLDEWIKAARRQLSTVHQQIRQNWMNQANQQDISSAEKGGNQGIKDLASPTFQSHQDFQQVRLNYEILLLKEKLTVSDLQRLLTQLESVKIEKDSSASLNQIKENLQTSLKALKGKNPLLAHFYLLACFNQVHSLFQQDKTSPVGILQQALNQSNIALQLFFLSEMMENGSSQSIPIRTILKNEQHKILALSTPFISSVLNEQNIRFHQAKDSSFSCQLSPWNQVIPLYDRGYRAAQSADSEFNKSVLNSQSITTYQEQTIKDWQQALKLMLHPPQKNASANTPQKWTETVRLIQEMYLQDQSQSEQKNEELHSW